MQSYNTAYGVIAGLENSSVERLKLTWAVCEREREREEEREREREGKGEREERGE